jgi:hypothetical protein
MGFSLFLEGDKLPSGVLFGVIPGKGGSDEVGRTQYNTSTGFSLKK